MHRRSYKELSRLDTYDERYAYLKLGGSVGRETFGSDRWLNQEFYRSRAWRDVRDYVIVRDHGREMGLEGYDMLGIIVVHHMNPIDELDIATSSDKLLDPDGLICVSPKLHRAIHYGLNDLRPHGLVERGPNDTTPWKEA